MLPYLICDPILSILFIIILSLHYFLQCCNIITRRALHMGSQLLWLPRT